MRRQTAIWFVAACAAVWGTGAARMAAAADPATVDDGSAVSARIDEIFAQAWREAGAKPAPLADDATFLRRTMLDLTGTIPEVGEARRFLDDPAADKRERLIKDLLNRPRHATHLANVWRAVLLPRTVPDSTSAAFEQWLQAQFRDNVPYDRLVRDILLTKGGLGQSPAVLYYAALDTKPSELAASSSRVFLGLQIRCAECHDHPFTAWKQDDFWSYAAFFARVRGPGQDGGAATLDDGPTGEVQNPATKKTVPPRFLDATPVSTTTDEPRRALLARWVTADENPYFAKAAVNRAWWMMFGRGLVQPVDDLGDHNPPTHPEVLDILAQDFVAHGYDLRRVFRIIAGTNVYQRSSHSVGQAAEMAQASTDLASSGGSGDNPIATYTSMPVRSLSARQVYDALVRAAGRREPLDPNSGAVFEERTAFLAQVDAPTRQATEFQGGIPQALTMLNGPFVSGLTDPWTSDLVAALADSPFFTDAERIDTLFLASLARHPTSAERDTILAWVAAQGAGGDKSQAFGDVLWALLNSSEFILNH
jgi:hypothetical protein